MTGDVDDELARGLLPLREGLEADGYTVTTTRTAGSIQIKVAATDEACEDCLIPRQALQTMAFALLSDAGIEVAADQLVVIYPEGSSAP